MKGALIVSLLANSALPPFQRSNTCGAQLGRFPLLGTFAAGSEGFPIMITTVVSRGVRSGHKVYNPKQSKNGGEL
jgi:hypothetical protein